ncbi:hypothetical protein BN1232_00132 [Mycobacterium numidiamassiliense]|uniref:ESX-1 secretion-associated protein EspJ n=1 Tax=Mycobacterium numidiamassiliense TaxID=1841861 RepID=A0A2U3P7E3_9MYCO|nr:hypothetical protein [Mycobacterium numidiamassiliense]SPM39503.1 hypothetical protein BN1232_00132 [Mycobacterium numidiamassiliense]SPM39678.1 hypothetical protein BN1232_00132 [Mycobacterium numidiamassiliense]
MTESLVVDPARLKAAGVTLRDQVLPAPPAPISAAGADPVSAAINVTMPVIEGPVVTGLPDVQAALTNTGSKIVTAAERYAETDQLLGEHVGTVQFLAAGERQPTDAVTEQPTTAAAPRQLGAETADKKTDEASDKKPDKKSQPTAPIDVNQLSAMAQAAQPLTQGMQSMMSSMQGMGTAGSSPAKLADDTKKDDTTTPDEPAAQLVDATTQDAEGAASGQQGSGSAPIQPPTGDRPETTSAETGL